MSFSLDGFWRSVAAYELPRCICCEAQVAVDEHGYCCRCHWKVQKEVEGGWPTLSSYLGNWAAFNDWEMSD